MVKSHMARGKLPKEKPKVLGKTHVNLGQHRKETEKEKVKTLQKDSERTDTIELHGSSEVNDSQQRYPFKTI